MRIGLINPLGVSLAHYTRALEGMLGTSMIDRGPINLEEPSASGLGRRRWVQAYLRALWAERNDIESEYLLITWPVLGFWDFVIARLVVNKPLIIIVHDPKPLVRAVGYGRIARWAAQRRASRSYVLVHSEAAREEVLRQVPRMEIVELPHPMMEPRSGKTHHDGETVLRVLGQYKADRDLSALEEIAATCDSRWRFEIIGRGWPEVRGWGVKDEFVSEDGLDELIHTSDVVIIPYKRFFQSGIALRCLENGTAVVGPRDSSLEVLLGVDSGWLAHAGDWKSAIETAVGSGLKMRHDIGEAVYRDAQGRWGAWLERLDNHPQIDTGNRVQ
jgi:hypothetical protein